MVEVLTFSVMFLLFALRVPIAFSMAWIAVTYMLLIGDASFVVIPQRMVNALDSFPLMAIPFFVLTGRLMNSCGATDHIFGFANSLVGHLRGGLGHVNVVANMIMAGMSGSAVADASGLGVVLLRAMERQGYGKKFAAALTGSAAIIGPIIPPSIPFVIYGSLVNVSVGRLFLGGIGPGVLLGLSFMTRVYILSVKRDYPRGERTKLLDLLRSFKTSAPALFLVFLLIGGILSGYFTPTEAAAVSAIYALFLGIFVYPRLTLATLIEDLIESAKTVCVLLLIISAAAAFGIVLARNRIPQIVVAALLSISSNRLVLLLIINVLLFILGCIMEGTAVIIILGPVFAAVAQGVGLDPVFMGVMVVLNLMIGLLTPPVGMIIYVMNRIAGLSMREFMEEAWGFVWMALIVVVLICLFPGLVTFIPNLLMGKAM
jgi:tripartite ATP-independent transporter DctM subunit